MTFERASGILLHPTSLPGPYGIGDLGGQAYQWIEFLSGAGCSLWQVLPLGPTGYGDSPYQSFSAFAGNPYLVSPQLLLENGLLSANDLSERPNFPEGSVDYGMVIPWKLRLLDQAFESFKGPAGDPLREAFTSFQEQNALWLEVYCLFMALKDAHKGAPWATWEAPLRSREPAALQEARKRYAQEIQRHMVRQFLFFHQWDDLHRYARKKGIRIIGDIPIFVAYDSADVWANPELFFLDPEGKPSLVAGVPPDYFSPTGQLWGNPLYRWEVHQAQGFKWWLDRLRAVLHMVDIVRLDHFRGFVAYWEVEADAETAEHGRWRPGPGEKFFQTVEGALGELPIIAEDLGEITPDVFALRDQFELPGMKILVFAFDSGPDNQFLPHNFVKNSVVYTGTHDNDTVRGWYQRVEDWEREFFHRYLKYEGQDIPGKLIQTAWASVSDLALAPWQDFLGLDNQARMNYPGRPSGNWAWRMPEDSLSQDRMNYLNDLNWIYGRRAPKAPTG